MLWISLLLRNQSSSRRLLALLRRASLPICLHAGLAALPTQAPCSLLASPVTQMAHTATASTPCWRVFGGAQAWNRPGRLAWPRRRAAQHERSRTPSPLPAPPRPPSRLGRRRGGDRDVASTSYRAASATPGRRRRPSLRLRRRRSAATAWPGGEAQRLQRMLAAGAWVPSWPATGRRLRVGGHRGLQPRFASAPARPHHASELFLVAAFASRSAQTGSATGTGNLSDEDAPVICLQLIDLLAEHAEP